MKKLLLASTALVATAGWAAADVAVTGSAEMGIFGGEDIESQFHTDINVDFALSGESDNGISFGAEIGLEEAQDGVATTIEDDFTVFISAGGATLTMGDTDGAFDKALTEVNVVGASILDDETAHAGFSGNGGPVSLGSITDLVYFDTSAGVLVSGSGGFVSGEDIVVIATDEDDTGTSMGLDGTEDGQIARFDYTFDAFTGSISAELDDSGDDAPVWGLGVAYSGDLAGLTLGVGLGYQVQNDVAHVTGISLDTSFTNGLSAAINYSVYSADDEAPLPDHHHFGIGVGYEMNAFAIGVNYGVFTITDGAFEDDTLSGWGLAAQYDFGGGLSAHLGYGLSMIDEDIADAVGDDEEFDTWSLGLAMSF